LMEVIHRNPGAMNTEVEKIMGHKLPTVGVGQPVELAVQMLETAPALLVLSGGRPLSVLTRTDLLSYFTAIAEDAVGRD
jgi:cystathionine beta-synthase